MNTALIRVTFDSDDKNAGKVLAEESQRIVDKWGGIQVPSLTTKSIKYELISESPPKKDGGLTGFLIGAITSLLAIQLLG